MIEGGDETGLAKENEARPAKTQEPGPLVEADGGLDSVSSEVRKAMSLLVQHQESFHGPIPPPEVLAKYEDVQPGLAERIMVMAEQQSAHRRSLESAVTGGNTAAQQRGQWFALITTLAIVGVCGMAIWQGHPLTGLSGIILALASLVGVFVYNKRKQTEERQMAREDMAQLSGQPPSE